MPSGAFHSNFWGPDIVTGPPPPIGSSASGGYVPWMTTVTVISLLLAAIAAW